MSIGLPQEQSGTTSISVVIPTFNRPQGLARALGSVLGQQTTLRVDLEVVVVDDGSDPPVALAEADPRLRVIRNPSPGGPALARNAGVECAVGEFVAFLDDDDWWLPGKIEVVLKALLDHPSAGVVFHGVVWASPAITPSPSTSALVPDPLERMLLRQPPHLSGVVVRRDLHAASPFDATFFAAEDLDYLIRMAGITTMAEIPQPYAVHGDDGVPSAISMNARIAGRMHLREKHAQLYKDRRIEAFHLVRLAHLHRMAGRHAEGIRLLAMAGRHAPFSVPVWKGLAVTMLSAVGLRR